MTEFSAQANLDVQVDDASLAQAKREIEQELGGASVTVEGSADGSQSGGDDSGSGVASGVQLEIMRRTLSAQQRSADLDEETGKKLDELIDVVGGSGAGFSPGGGGAAGAVPSGSASAMQGQMGGVLDAQRDLVDLGERRNDYLDDILDQLQQGGVGGGGGGGGDLLGTGLQFLGIRSILGGGVGGGILGGLLSAAGSVSGPQAALGGTAGLLALQGISMRQMYGPDAPDNPRTEFVREFSGGTPGGRQLMGHILATRFGFRAPTDGDTPATEAFNAEEIFGLGEDFLGGFESLTQMDLGGGWEDMMDIIQDPDLTSLQQQLQQIDAPPWLEQLTDPDITTDGDTTTTDETGSGTSDRPPKPEGPNEFVWNKQTGTWQPKSVQRFQERTRGSFSQTSQPGGTDEWRFDPSSGTWQPRSTQQATQSNNNPQVNVRVDQTVEQPQQGRQQGMSVEELQREVQRLRRQIENVAQDFVDDVYRPGGG